MVTFVCVGTESVGMLDAVTLLLYCDTVAIEVACPLLIVGTGNTSVRAENVIRRMTDVPINAKPHRSRFFGVIVIMTRSQKPNVEGERR